MKKIFSFVLMAFVFSALMVSCASNSGRDSSEEDEFDYDEYNDDWWLSYLDEDEDEPLDLEHGTVTKTGSGFVYENRDVGLGLKLPSSAVVISGDDLEGMQNDPSTLVDLMAIVNSNYVHAVSISDGGDSAAENESFANSEFFMSIMETLLVSGWENSGIVPKDHGTKPMKFLGKEVYGIYFNGDVMGHDAWYYVVSKQKGRLIAMVILGGLDEAGVEAMLDDYYELSK